MVKFSEAENVKFVTLYSSYECLWNTRLSSYKNRKTRKMALFEMAREMGKDNFKTVQDVATKIKNLRSTYYQEIKKIENSKKSGAGDDELYTPTVAWFDILHSILQPFVHRRTFEMTNGNQEDEDCKNVQIEYIGIDDQDQDDYSTTTDNYEIENTASNQRIENGASTEDTNVVSKLDPLPVNHIRAKKRKMVPSMTLANDPIAGFSGRTSTNIKDEFDVFGQYIAISLKKLPPEIAADAELEINQILHNKKIEALKTQQVWNT